MSESLVRQLQHTSLGNICAPSRRGGAALLATHGRIRTSVGQWHGKGRLPHVVWSARPVGWDHSKQSEGAPARPKPRNDEHLFVVPSMPHLICINHKIYSRCPRDVFAITLNAVSKGCPCGYCCAHSCALKGRNKERHVHGHVRPGRISGRTHAGGGS